MRQGNWLLSYVVPRIELQVQILSMLDHPNIVSYYDNFEEDGVLMIEMEYADGGCVGYAILTS